MIFRIKKTRCYTVIDNGLLQSDMSLRAKGLLALMLSLPDDWDYSLNGLMAICHESRTTVNAALKELKERGYVEVVQARDEHGRIGYEYNVYEVPQADEYQEPQQEAPQEELQEQQEQSAPRSDKADMPHEGPRKRKNASNPPYTSLPYTVGPCTVEPYTVGPCTVEPYTVGPYTVNRPQQSNNIQSNIYINTNKQKNTADITNTETKKDISTKKQERYTPAEQAAISEVIDHLNEVTGRQYKATTLETRRLIHARLSEGYTVEDCKTVIDKKWAEWHGDPRMGGYLRPATLFQAAKFEAYLNQPAPVPQPRRQKAINPFLDLIGGGEYLDDG